MLSDLTGRVALVTGTGSPEGIGFATARLLLAQGASVAITSTTERIRERAAELGSDRILSSVCDLRGFDNVANLIREDIEHFGKLDPLVNNAGMVQLGTQARVATVNSWTDQPCDRPIEANLKTC